MQIIITIYVRNRFRDISYVQLSKLITKYTFIIKSKHDNNFFFKRSQFYQKEFDHWKLWFKSFIQPSLSKSVSITREFVFICIKKPYLNKFAVIHFCNIKNIFYWNSWKSLKFELTTITQNDFQEFQVTKSN